MDGKNIGIIILYALGVLLGLISIVMAYFSLSGEYDTEPLLGFGLLFVAIAGLKSLKKWGSWYFGIEIITWQFLRIKHDTNLNR